MATINLRDFYPWYTHEVMEYKHRFCRLCCALNSLPETQGRRIVEHYILSRSITDNAKAEGVSKSSVSESISTGLRRMKKYM